MGDAQLTVHSAILNFDMVALYENWHQTMLDQQRNGCITSSEASNRTATGVYKPHNWACEHVPVNGLPESAYIGSTGDVVPQDYNGMGLWPGDVSWQVAAVIIPHELLTQYADLPWLSRNYDGPRAMVTFFNALATADPTSNGLVPWSYLGDWIPVPPASINTVSRYLVANIHYMIGALFCADIAAAVGNTQDAAVLYALAAQVSSQIPKSFWNTTNGYYDTGTQAAQVLALAFNVGGSNYTQGSLTQLILNIQQNDWHLTVGAAGARYILQTLQGAGRTDVALALAVQGTYPSWGYFVSSPDFPGTHWEAWDGNGTYADGSKNHIFKAGGIGSYVYEGILGLHVAHRAPSPSAADATALPWTHKEDNDACTPCAAMDLLPFDIRSRVPNVRCEHITAVCSVLTSRLQKLNAANEANDDAAVSALHKLASIERDIEAAFASSALSAATSASELQGLEKRAALVVDTHAALALGSAQGWRSVAGGNLTFAWRYDAAANSIDVEATVASGVVAVLEVPLSLVSAVERGGKAARVSVRGESALRTAIQADLQVSTDTATDGNTRFMLEQKGIGSALTAHLCKAGAAHRWAEGRSLAEFGDSSDVPALQEAAIAIRLPAGRHTLRFSA
jgi:hypothetical protein